MQPRCGLRTRIPQNPPGHGLCGAVQPRTLRGVQLRCANLLVNALHKRTRRFSESVRREMDARHRRRRTPIRPLSPRMILRLKNSPLKLIAQPRLAHPRSTIHNAHGTGEAMHMLCYVHQTLQV